MATKHPTDIVRSTLAVFFIGLLIATCLWILRPFLFSLAWAPWHVVRSNDKKRARLNTIQNILHSIEYKELKAEKIVLAKRKIGEIYQEIDYPFKFIPELY